MDWSSVETLPWFWEPFHSLWFAIACILVIPAATAFVFSLLMFQKRVGDVYFSIVTLALSLTLSVFIVGQQGYTGGINGITDFRTFAGWDISSDTSKRTLYFITVAILLAVIVIGRTIIRTRLGKVLVAIRDREDRVRFSGYNPATFKAFVFAVAALYAAIGGALYTIQVGLMSPTLVAPPSSVEMVIFAAVGGRTVAGGGRIRNAAGRHVEIVSFRDLSGAVALPPRRAVHWHRADPARGARRRTQPAGGKADGETRCARRARDRPRRRTRYSANPMSAVILSVKDLTVSFDGFKAVSNLDLDVEEDELRVVIGPNGAGKTTLLDMICGKTKPTSGSIRFKDLELTKLNEYKIVRAGVGRKFQTPSTYEDLVVFENLQISYPGRREGSSGRSSTAAMRSSSRRSTTWRNESICATTCTPRRAG